MKKALSFVALILMIAVMIGVIVSSAASGPNRGWTSGSAINPVAHVQIQPSYLDSGRHALEGKVRLVIQLMSGSIEYTSYAYTEEAINILDSNYYTAQVDRIINLGSQGFHQEAFHWFPDGNWSSY